MQKILITGSAGFIGFHLARHLLAAGHRVHGFDGMTPYYDVALKRQRHAVLLQTPGFSATEAMLEDMATLAGVAVILGTTVWYLWVQTRWLARIEGVGRIAALIWAVAAFAMSTALVSGMGRLIA